VLRGPARRGGASLVHGGGGGGAPVRPPIGRTAGAAVTVAVGGGKRWLQRIAVPSSYANR